MTHWLNKWLEIGFETKRGDYGPDARMPIRSYLAWFLVNRLHLG